MNVISATRNLIARLDTEDPRTERDGEIYSAELAAQGNAIAGILHGVNAFAAGTPLVFVTGPVAIAYGGAQFLAGMIADSSERVGWSAKNGQGKVHMLGGAKLVVGGSAAFAPGIGNVLNGALAAMDGVQLVNALLPHPPRTH